MTGDIVPRKHPGSPKEFERFTVEDSGETAWKRARFVLLPACREVARDSPIRHSIGDSFPLSYQQAGLLEVNSILRVRGRRGHVQLRQTQTFPRWGKTLKHLELFVIFDHLQAISTRSRLTKVARPTGLEPVFPP